MHEFKRQMQVYCYHTNAWIHGYNEVLYSNHPTAESEIITACTTVYLNLLKEETVSQILTSRSRTVNGSSCIMLNCKVETAAPGVTPLLSTK